MLYHTIIYKQKLFREFKELRMLRVLETKKFENNCSTGRDKKEKEKKQKQKSRHRGK